MVRTHVDFWLYLSELVLELEPFVLDLCELLLCEGAVLLDELELVPERGQLGGHLVELLLGARVLCQVRVPLGLCVCLLGVSSLLELAELALKRIVRLLVVLEQVALQMDKDVGVSKAHISGGAGRTHESLLLRQGACSKANINVQPLVVCKKWTKKPAKRFSFCE